MAAERVKNEVSARDWKIWSDLAGTKRPAKEIAHEVEMQVAAVLVVKSRVQKRLRETVRQLANESGIE